MCDVKLACRDVTQSIRRDAVIGSGLRRRRNLTKLQHQRN